MSLTSSRGLGASASALSASDSKPSPSARLTPTPVPSSESIGPTFPTLETSPSSQQELFPTQTFGAEASPVRTYPSLTRTPQDLRESDLVFGGSSQDLSELCVLDGSCWKTYQHSFDGSLETFSGSFPKSGTCVSGKCYQRGPLELCTDESESGLLPTPTAYRDGNKPEDHLRRKLEIGKNNPTVTSLDVWFRSVPTPSAQDGKGGGRSMKRILRAEKYGMNLRDFFSLKLNWLYPPVHMVEYLMGYPTDYTACDAWETRSTRPSRVGSVKGLKKSKEQHE